MKKQKLEQISVDIYLDVDFSTSKHNILDQIIT